MSTRRSIADFPRNETGLVDEFIGTAYDTVKSVSDDLPFLHELESNIPTMGSEAVENALNAQLPAVRDELNSIVETAKETTAHLLSPAATAPDKRDDGSPLQEGDRYFNTTSNMEYIYSGTEWVVSDGLEAARQLEADLASTARGAKKVAYGPGTVDTALNTLNNQMAAIPSQVDAKGTANAVVLGHDSDPTAHPELAAQVAVEALRSAEAADRAEAALAGAQTGVAIYRSFITEAEMNADLNAAPGMVAVVTGGVDNLFFTKVGAIGSGSWTPFINQPASTAQLEREIEKNLNRITGNNDLIEDITTGDRITGLQSRSRTASTVMDGLNAIAGIDTQSKRNWTDFTLERKEDLFAVMGAGHWDQRNLDRMKSLPFSEYAEVWGTDDGSIAFRIDSVNKRIFTDYLLEDRTEQRPPTVFVDVPPRLERNVNDPDYRLSGRVYQATASVVRTKTGRLWLTWRADNQTAAEAPGNFAVIAYSDDDGLTVKEVGIFTYTAANDPLNPLPIEQRAGRDKHLVDPMLWLDPEGKMWLFFGVFGNNMHFDCVQGTWAAICPNPDGEIAQWGKAFRLSYYRSPRHPVLVNGEYYLAMDGWRFDANYPPRYMDMAGGAIYKFDWRRKKVFLHSKLPPNYNGGYTGFFETEFAEQPDGNVIVTNRMPAGTSVSRSTDGMLTWEPWVDYAEVAPSASSRTWLGNAPSGRMVYCWNNNLNRQALMLGLSEDGGVTYPWRVRLESDSVGQVTYPVVAFGEGGDMYIAYDNERTSGKRQIRLAKVNEAEIIAGTAVPRVTVLSNPFNP